MPKVSVIIPVYNAAGYLKDCLDSLQNQSFTDFEALLIDDGSTDHSRDILERYARLDSRFIVLRQPNGGASRARNTGLERAQGEYICFTDADDLLHPQYLETLLYFAQTYGAQLVTAQYTPFAQTLPKWQPLDLPSLAFVKSENPVLLGCHGSACAVHYTAWGKLYHRSLLAQESFPQDQVFYEDVPFLYDVLAQRPVATSLSAPLYAYRNTEGSLTNRRSGLRHIEDLSRALGRITRRYEQAGLEEEKRFLTTDFIPSILKNALYRCRHADKTIRRKMFALFGQELARLQRTGWLQKKGNSWRKFVVYHCLIQLYKRGVL